ncbi:MAG TPA: VOC family protein [Acidobacteriaceae bacterium]|jgi:PhnB protein|nr:VOC family protein [Acidobacteriaceae bacterium]
MKTDLHLVFSGKCRDAFAFYEKTFNSKVQFCMTFGEAPEGSPVPPDSKDLIMHTAMPLGNLTLMGCDAPKGREETLGGFQISVTGDSTDEATRLFDALKAGGTVQMPLAKTFWSPLFGMCTDKFGVAWMVSVPGPQM